MLTSMPATTSARIARRLPWLALSLAAAAIAACSRPEPPNHEDRPEPQAATPAAVSAPPSPLRESIQQPIDQAQAVKTATEEAARRQREAIDAATGG